MRLIPQKRDFLHSSFSQLEKKWQVLFEKHLGRYDLSYAQYVLLDLLVSKFNYPPAVKEAASAMETSHQNVKQVAEVLEKKGCLQFVADTKDKRVLRLQILPPGDALISEFRERRKELVRSFFSGLEDAEIETLFDLLLKLERKADELLLKRSKSN